MSTENPYKTPEAAIATESGLSESQFSHLANGQKWIIYSILMYFLAGVFVVLLSPVFAVLILVAFVLALVGIVRVLIGIESHLAIKVLYILMMFLPLINLFALARLNNKVTVALREAGYSVGFLGVKK